MYLNGVYLIVVLSNVGYYYQLSYDKSFVVPTLVRFSVKVLTYHTPYLRTRHVRSVTSL